MTHVERVRYISKPSVPKKIPAFNFNGIHVQLRRNTHPWDRVISHYYWCHREEPRPTIAEYLESSKILILKRRGYDLITIDGQIAVDKVYRYENLEEELEQLRVRLGIPGKLELPATKNTTRKDRRHYREVLGEFERVRIADLFRDDLEAFGYCF